MSTLPPLKILVFVTISSHHHVTSNMDFTYSAADLYRLVQTEQSLSRILDEVGKSVDKFQQQLNSFQNPRLDKYQTDLILKNPILSYHLMKKHGRDLESFDETFQQFTARIEELRVSYVKATSFTKATRTDVKHSMEAIVRLRQTYNLSVDEVLPKLLLTKSLNSLSMSKGRIGSLQVEGSLSKRDLADIGLYALDSGMHTNARLFLTTALTTNDEAESVSESWVINAQNALKDLEQSSIKRPDREDFRVLTEMDAVFATDSIDNLNTAFESMCQIHAVKDPPVSNLKCYLDSHSHPVRKLSPLKLEVYHKDPQIVVIYDFLSDSEIQEIESATFYKLKRSVIQVYQDGALNMEPSIIRNTSQTWIHDLGHPQFGYLSKRIESVTGYYLSGENSAEELQIASYRPGGHYSIHTDATQEEILKEFLQPIDLIQGDRMATFMLYLSDVEMGGNTAFPLLNVSVRPVKGSAILWGNLYLDGSIARNTLHGACPVVYGIKTIATKWIRANDQMFTRHKCKPDKSSDHYSLR